MRFSACALLCGIVALPVLAQAQPAVTPLPTSSDLYCRTNGQADYPIFQNGACPGVYVIKVSPSVVHFTHCPTSNSFRVTGHNRSSIVYECFDMSETTIYRRFECKNPAQDIKHRGIIADRVSINDAVWCENPPSLRVR